MSVATAPQGITARTIGLSVSLPTDDPDAVLTGERHIVGQPGNHCHWTGSQWTSAQWTGSQWTCIDLYSAIWE